MCKKDQPKVETEPNSDILKEDKPDTEEDSAIIEIALDIYRSMGYIE